MKNVFWKEVDQALAAKRQRRPWLAKQTGISLGRINNWYVRGTLPRVDDAVKIARALGVTVRQLVSGKPLLTVTDLPNNLRDLVIRLMQMDNTDQGRIIVICKAIMALMEQGILDMPLNTYVKMTRQVKASPSGSLQPDEKDQDGYTSE